MMGTERTAAIDRVRQAIWDVTSKWEIAADIGDTLNIEDILAAHVPPRQHYLLDRWLHAQRTLCRSMEDLALECRMMRLELGDEDE
jgi:hypothetical protein